MGERKELCFANLPDFDYGRAATAFDQALEVVQKDCIDRPALEKAREVSLKVQIRPGNSAGGGELDDCQVKFAVSSKIPGYETQERPVAISRQGQFSFQPDAPDNPRQGTFTEDH